MTAQLFKGKKIGPKCHTKHPILKLGMGEILGASCGSPREGFDIYIGFCYTMTYQHQPYPWETKHSPIVEFQYNITDMHAPKSPKDFKKLIEWVWEQLELGKRIHVGCIGGHGRTGTFLAALVSKAEDLTDDPIKWVRENHCKKGVESEAQIKFLVKHFGCKTAKPSKQAWTGHVTKEGKNWSTHEWENHWQEQAGEPSNVTRLPRGGDKERMKFVSGKGSIWG